MPELKAENAGKAGGASRITKNQEGTGRLPLMNLLLDPCGGDAFYGHSMGGDTERTTWDFSKSVKENTFSRDYTFDVEKTVNTVVMSVMGDCKAGEIRIKIVMPRR